MKNKTAVFSLSLSAVFTALFVILAQIVLPAPIPFTLQTFGVFVACLLLGRVKTLCAVGAYLALGFFGLPVFSGFGAGAAHLFGPTGGFLFGFLLIPFISGFFSRKRQWLGLLIGLALCYAFGIVWFALWTGENSLWQLLLLILPFVLPDIAKLFLALLVSRRLSSALSKMGILSNGELSKTRIAQLIDQKAEVVVFDSVDSTNTFSVNAVREKAKLPLLVLAEKQTAGRGRRGRSFFSEGGLYMSLALPAKLLPKDSVGVTTLVSVAVAEAVEELTGVSLGIKWVNDLYLRDKKVCGILCESVADKESGELMAVVIGIGINLSVKRFPDELHASAANLGALVSKSCLSAEITKRIFSIIEDPNDYIDRYKRRSIVLGKKVRYEENGQTFTATAEDIDQNGGLLVVREDGGRTTLSSGEITLRFDE